MTKQRLIGERVLTLTVQDFLAVMSSLSKEPSCLPPITKTWSAITLPWFAVGQSIRGSIDEGWSIFSILKLSDAILAVHVDII